MLKVVASANGSAEEFDAYQLATFTDATTLLMAHNDDFGGQYSGKESVGASKNKKIGDGGELRQPFSCQFLFSLAGAGLSSHKNRGGVSPAERLGVSCGTGHYIQAESGQAAQIALRYNGSGTDVQGMIFHVPWSSRLG